MSLKWAKISSTLEKLGPAYPRARIPSCPNWS